MRASPESYTPRHLAEKILAGRDALAGERKQVTILFADVVGSTELIRDRDPEDAQQLLDGAVQRMMKAVHRYEGTVSRLQGDGLMAMFGAPVAHEDHAVRACYAALAMLEAARGYDEEVRQAHGATIQVRVGLNSGEVIVRLISDDLHMDYTAMGQTVHLAARMESLARSGTSLLSASTMALVEGFVEARSLGPTPVKGLDGPVEVFELVGAGTARTRLQASATRGLTRFVGRQRELDMVQAAVGRAHAGHGQVVALVGDPGTGKSRLVHEITHTPGAADWLVLENGAISYGTSTAYLPIVNLLKGYFRIEPGDDVGAMHGRISGRVLGLDPTLAPIVSPLLALLDVPVEDPSWVGLDPPGRRRATLDAVKRLLLRESQAQPILLVIEDLHWIDSESQALLDELVEALPTARLLLLVNYRPEYTHGWGSKSAYTQLRIDALAEEGAEALLVSLLGADASLEPLKRHLLSRTEGNPLFLEESVRSLVETRVLTGERGAYRLTGPVSETQVPATVQAVLAARIDRLPPEEKRLLQIAAVIGKDVPDGLLRAIVEGGEDDVRRGLARLQAAEFVYQARLFPELEYTFKHALTHEVAYGSLLQERKKTLHAHVVAAIEAAHADRLDEHVEVLAHHALRGELWDQAVGYCRQAGARAVGRSAHREAVTWFDQAVEALRHVAQGREAIELAIDLRVDLRQALQPIGQIRPALERLHEAAAMAEALGDGRRLGRICAFMTYSYWVLSLHDRAIEAGRRALSIAEALGDVPLRVVTSVPLAAVYRTCGDYPRAIESCKWTVAALGGDLVRERFGMAGYPAFEARALLGGTLAEVGEFAEGVAYGEEAVRIAEALDHPYSLALARNMLGFVHVTRGDLEQAASWLERGLDLCRSWDLPNLSVWAYSGLGITYARAGRADGLALLEQAVEIATSRELMTSAALRAAWLGEAHLLAGSARDALRQARHALALATEYNERGSQIHARWLLAEIAAQCEPPDADEAEALYREALALAEELGMRPLQARCHLGLGKLHRRVGRREEARAELVTAVTMLREMGMAFWLPEAEAELAQSNASTLVEPAG